MFQFLIGWLQTSTRPTGKAQTLRGFNSLQVGYKLLALQKAGEVKRSFNSLQVGYKLQKRPLYGWIWTQFQFLIGWLQTTFKEHPWVNGGSFNSLQVGYKLNEVDKLGVWKRGFNSLQVGYKLGTVYFIVDKFLKFQFLIGWLQTPRPFSSSKTGSKSFQFLIGWLQTHLDISG